MKLRSTEDSPGKSPATAAADTVEDADPDEFSDSAPPGEPRAFTRESVTVVSPEEEARESSLTHSNPPSPTRRGLPKKARLQGDDTAVARAFGTATDANGALPDDDVDPGLVRAQSFDVEGSMLEPEDQDLAQLAQLLGNNDPPFTPTVASPANDEVRMRALAAATSVARPPPAAAGAQDPSSIVHPTETWRAEEYKERLIVASDQVAEAIEAQKQRSRQFVPTLIPDLRGAVFESKLGESVAASLLLSLWGTPDRASNSCLTIPLPVLLHPCRSILESGRVGYKPASCLSSSWNASRMVKPTRCSCQFDGQR